MKDSIISIHGVSKKYGDQEVLKNINLTVKKKDIYGFIGENGAGKTTLLKIISGLCSPNKGSYSLFGKSLPDDIRNVRKRTGILIETPTLYNSKTAYENMELMRIIKGIPEKDCIQEKLALVGLSNVSSKKVKAFSLGMKQRLGLALALLGDPELLILDEPINGLDPSGIVDIREILKKLNKEHGVTILISSHILTELTQLATSFCIIHKGEILEKLSAEELQAKCRKLIHIKVDDASRVSVILEQTFKTENYKVLPGNIIHLYGSHWDSSEVTRVLAQNNIGINEIMPMGETLEDYYTTLIGGGKNA